MTFRYGILEASAEEILAELCDSTNDAEKVNRLQVLRNIMYRAAPNNRKIADSNRLLEAIYTM
jgi:hypothetical protein